MGSGLHSHGLARSSARFGSRSGSEFGLTQGSSLGSRNGDSARSTLLEDRLGLLKARLSSRLGLSQFGDRLSAARLDSLFEARLISARSSGWARDSARESEISSILGLAQLGARLRLSSGPSSGFSWGLARGSGLEIRHGLS